jgi:hypothetical protein
MAFFHINANPMVLKIMIKKKNSLVLKEWILVLSLIFNHQIYSSNIRWKSEKSIFTHAYHYTLTPSILSSTKSHTNWKLDRKEVSNIDCIFFSKKVLMKKYFDSSDQQKIISNTSKFSKSFTIVLCIIEMIILEKESDPTKFTKPDNNKPPSVARYSSGRNTTTSKFSCAYKTCNYIPLNEHLCFYYTSYREKV